MRLRAALSMSFFDRPDDIWDGAPDAGGHYRSEAPGGVIPGEVGVREVLAESLGATVTLVISRAYPEGFEFNIEVMTRHPWPDDAPDWSTASQIGLDDLDAIPETGPPAWLLRIGVQYPDGGRASSLPWIKQARPGLVRPLLFAQGGGGLSDAYVESFWMTPLPSSGPLTFVVKWPAFEIKEQEHVVPAALILSAATRSRPVQRNS